MKPITGPSNMMPPEGEPVTLGEFLDRLDEEGFEQVEHDYEPSTYRVVGPYMVFLYIDGLRGVSVRRRSEGSQLLINGVEVDTIEEAMEAAGL